MSKGRKVFHWILVVIFLLMALGGIGSGNIPVAILNLVLCVIALPFGPVAQMHGGKRVLKWVLSIVLMFVCVGLMPSGSGQNATAANSSSEASTVSSSGFTVAETAAPTETSAPTETPTNTPTPTEAPTAAPTEVPTATPAPTATPTPVPASFDLSSVPAYSDSPYAVVNNNTPFFTSSDLTTEAFENYSDLDSLGRCGVAYANVCTEIMPTEERGNIGSIKPTGWHTVKYNGIDGNYLYNRCHLIGYQLSAENANEKNLITGTRYLNVQGMLPFENMVADYVKETNNHVLYRVTPIFEGNNLLASGVLMEAESVEDDGNGILFCVYCYNVQPGITIDYVTGDSDGPEFTGSENQSGQGSNGSGGSGGSGQDVATPTPTETPQTVTEDTNAQTYVLNTNTKKFHYPSCSSVNQMKDKNKKVVTESRDQIIAEGYEPCKRCNP